MSQNTINGLLLDAAQAIVDGMPGTARAFVDRALRLAMLDQSIPAFRVAAISRAVSAVAAI